MSQKVVEIKNRMNPNDKKYKKDLIDNPETVGDLSDNFKQLLINYGNFLDDMLQAYEDEASENGAENPAAIESLEKMREKLVDVRNFLVGLKEKHDNYIKAYADVLDEKFTLTIDNESNTEAFAVAQVKLSVKNKTMIDIKGVFQKAAWPTDKEEKAPTFILMEAQRRLRKTKSFLWGAEEDYI